MTEHQSSVAFDEVNKARHYNCHPSGVECIDIVEAMGFNLGNAVKYLFRADIKGARSKDLEKARYYVEREIGRWQRGFASPCDENADFPHDLCARVVQAESREHVASALKSIFYAETVKRLRMAVAAIDNELGVVGDAD